MMRTWIVLNGKVKLTERRREILFHIACTDDMRYPVMPVFRGGRGNPPNGFHPRPLLGGVNVEGIVRYLRRHRLVRWSVPMGLLRTPRCPAPTITARGMDALLETVGGLT